MQIIKAGYQLINEPSITRKIERIARICYKSEDKIGEKTDIQMINNLMERKHTAMLEHGDFAMIVDEDTYTTFRVLVGNIETMIWADMESDNRKCYLRFSTYKKDAATPERFVISGNVRAWLEVMDIACLRGGWIIPDSLYDTLVAGFPLFEGRYLHDDDDSNCNCTLVTDYTELSDAERMIHETMSVLFTVDRGVTHELVRHRDCSFAQESTRYCNYSLGKHGHEITVIEPCFFARPDTVTSPTEEWAEKYGAWEHACHEAEKAYFRLMDAKAPAQQARDVLPTSVKAEIVMTATLREWRHIFSLRACDSTGPAHPQMKEVMIPCLKEVRPTYDFAFGNLIAADEVTK